MHLVTFNRSYKMQKMRWPSWGPLEVENCIFESAEENLLVSSVEGIPGTVSTEKKKKVLPTCRTMNNCLFLPPGDHCVESELSSQLWIILPLQRALRKQPNKSVDTNYSRIRAGKYGWRDNKVCWKGCIGYFFLLLFLPPAELTATRRQKVGEGTKQLYNALASVI